MHLQRIVWTVAAFGTALSLARPAAAQSIEGTVQLELATDLVSYSRATVENDDTGVEVDTSVFNWGVRENVAFELGYGLSELVVLGAFLRLGGDSQTIELANGDETESSEFAVQIGPKLDLVLGQRTSEVRPFVGLAVALESSTLREEDSGLETSLLGVNLQGRAGLHWFVLPAFSIDPMFAVAWGTASGEVDEIDGNDSVDISGSGFNVALIVGISGWI